MKLSKLFFFLLLTLMAIYCNNNGGSTVQKVRISAIIVSSESKAQEIIDMLNNKEDFSSLVRKYSIGANKLEGGDLGFITYEDMGIELRNAIKDKDIGEYSDYVLFNNQYYILLKTDEKIEKIETDKGEIMPSSNLFFAFLPFIIIGVFVIWPFWKIFSKAGFSGWLSLIMLIPLLNVIMIFYLAFSEWPALKKETGSQV